jgi:flagellar protein FliS
MVTQQDLDRWREMQIRTQTPERLLVMLFDALLVRIGEARTAIAASRIEAAHNALVGGQDLLGGLSAAFNPDWPPTVNLRRIFAFCRRRLMDANFEKAVAPLDEVEPLIRTLRETFLQVAERGRDAASGTARIDIAG